MLTQKSCSKVIGMTPGDFTVVPAKTMNGILHGQAGNVMDISGAIAGVIFMGLEVGPGGMRWDVYILHNKVFLDNLMARSRFVFGSTLFFLIFDATRMFS